MGQRVIFINQTNIYLLLLVWKIIEANRTVYIIFLPVHWFVQNNNTIFYLTIRQCVALKMGGYVLVYISKIMSNVSETFYACTWLWFTVSMLLLQQMTKDRFYLLSYKLLPQQVQSITKLYRIEADLLVVNLHLLLWR